MKWRQEAAELEAAGGGTEAAGRCGAKRIEKVEILLHLPSRCQNCSHPIQKPERPEARTVRNQTAFEKKPCAAYSNETNWSSTAAGLAYYWKGACVDRCLRHR